LLDSIISDGTIGHSRIGEESILQNERFSFIPVQKNGIGQVGSTEVGEPNTRGVDQISLSQVASNELSLIQKSSGQVSPSQIGFVEKGLNQTSSSQVGFIQVDLAHVLLRQVSIDQNNTLQVGPSQFTQQSAITKITLPGSVAVQQFFGFESNESHNFNFQNTTIPTWTEFLTGTTPFNLKIEITDRPTGQLAEANITHFDSNGLPTSGTLTLDTDANGLGWFIHSTPWENSEFGTLNAETFFRATLGSAAYGHYDLLTTILHVRAAFALANARPPRGPYQVNSTNCSPNGTIGPPTTYLSSDNHDR
jgi:hypothetical protein